MTEPVIENRRPIASRSSHWASWLASALVRTDITPNQISVCSALFAAAGAAALLCLSGYPGLLLCAVCIQCRLVCNLIDGMVAVEGGKRSPVGELYNEFPDRVADSILIVALGYACELPWLGWSGALFAALTAYVRVFGGALGQAQSFRGPMAKQHRMAALTAACVLGAIESVFTASHYALTFAAWTIAIGSAITCVTRTCAIAAQLESR